MFAVLGTLLGARLGHVVFYQHEILTNNLWEIFKFWKQGLSSHGSAFGILLSMFFLVHKVQIRKGRIRFINRFSPENSYLKIMDRFVIGIAIGAVFIRVGNLVNSEIIGKPTQSNYGIVLLNPFTDKLMHTLPFVEHVAYAYSGSDFAPGYPNLDISVTFKNRPYYEKRIEAGIQRHLIKMLPSDPGDYESIFNPKGRDLKFNINRNKGAKTLVFSAVGVSRHPSQLYEAATLFLIFLILFGIWKFKGTQIKEGSILGWFLVLLFSLRFAQEYLKENQVMMERSMPLNFGQLLSLPFIIFGLILVVTGSSIKLRS